MGGREQCERQEKVKEGEEELLSQNAPQQVTEADLAVLPDADGDTYVGRMGGGWGSV